MDKLITRPLMIIFFILIMETVLILSSSLAQEYETSNNHHSIPSFSWSRFPWQSELERDHPLNGKIWSVRKKAYISPEKLVQELAKQPYIGIGEIHDNPDHHILQAWLIEQISQKGRRKPAVVMEMIDESKKLTLKRYLAQDKVTAKGLGKALKWRKSGWPEWSMYQPVAQIVLDERLALRAGNATKSLTRQVGRKGYDALDKAFRDKLHLSTPLPRILAKDLGRQIVSAHCNMIPATATAPMVRVQRLRDAVMAQNLIANTLRDGAILIAGNGHVRIDRGVPWYIARSGHKMVSVMIAEAEEGVINPMQLVSHSPEDYSIADYIWITPRTSRPDPCEQFRRFMKKKKR